MRSFRTSYFVFLFKRLKWVVPWPLILQTRLLFKLVLIFFTYHLGIAQSSVSVDCSVLFGGESPLGSNLTQEIRDWEVINGSTYLLGKTAAAAYFPSTDDSEVLGTEDFFIAKFDSNCNVVFARILNGMEECRLIVEDEFVHIAGTVNQLEASATGPYVTNGSAFRAMLISFTVN